MKKIVFASGNPNKVSEIAAVLAGEYEVLSLVDIGCTKEIPETGTKLQENAEIKARYVYNHFGIDCFADDTGLEIEALNGEPGVYSARYAGKKRDSLKNMEKVLRKLRGESNRKARFRTVICLIQSGRPFFFEGQVNGEILESPRGEQGFGYDPIFLPEGKKNSFAEMDAEEKNMISHRALAVQKLTEWLKGQK